jgi:UDP-glucose 4-epimerase
MKILIVGAGGYIGENFAEYATKHKQFDVDIVNSFKGWTRKNFEGYDSVIFAAGIAHRRQNKKNAHQYYAVNRDLAVAVAEKAKASNVPQFIYLSSMAVYGKKEGEISANTEAKPRHNDNYGKSKFEAENALKNLDTGGDFKVAIIRPPMVYGENCPGKYSQLARISKFLRIVPNNNNKRSMIYINSLSEFLCMIITTRENGTFCPQDAEYVNTAKLIAKMRQENGKKTTIIGAAWLISLCSAIFPPVKTAFASLYYKKDLD